MNGQRTIEAGSRFYREPSRFTNAELQRGGDTVLTRMVKRYHSGLVSYANLFTHDRDIAEDVVQEAWISLRNGISGLKKPKGDPLSFLITTVRYQSVDNLRYTRPGRFSSEIPVEGYVEGRYARDDEREYELDERNEKRDEEVPRKRPHKSKTTLSMEGYPIFSLGADEIALANIEVDNILALIRDLPDQQRDTIVLEILGITESEKAAILGTARGTIKSHMWRARTTLLQKIAETEKD